MIEVRFAADGTDCALIIDGRERPCEPGWLVTYQGATHFYPADLWARPHGGLSARSLTLHGPEGARIVLDLEALTVEELTLDGDQFRLRQVHARPAYPR